MWSVDIGCERELVIRGKSLLLGQSACDSPRDGRFACTGHAIQPEYSLLAWVGTPLHDLAKNINTGV